MDKKASKLFVFEGIDGSGKSTVIRKVFVDLLKAGRSCMRTAEPTGSPFGMRVRTMGRELSPEEERRLFLDDRHFHVTHTILPELEKGTIVLCDRYYASSVAYQGSRSDALPDSANPEDFWHLQQDILTENQKIAPQPDLWIYLDVDPKISLARASERGISDSYEKMEELLRVRSVYLKLFPNILRPSVVIDASCSEEELFVRVRDAIRERL